VRRPASRPRRRRRYLGRNEVFRAQWDTMQNKNSRVLLADDDPTTRLLGESYLTAAGFEVRVATDGQAALEAFSDYGPDLVVLDVEMPQMNGFEACRAIRARFPDNQIPIVMLTGLEDTASMNEAFEAGATDFICKPVHWPTLPHRLRYVLRATDNLLALAASERDTVALLRALPDRILVVDREGMTRDGFGAASGRPQALEDVFPEHVARQAREYLAEALVTRESMAFEFEVEGEEKYFELRMIAHQASSVIAIVRDVTERKQADARIHQLAFFDTLTGLPNRQQMVRNLRRVLDAGKRTGRGVAVLYIDLDQFKRINDTLGHTIGDSLLKTVAKRLESGLRASDYVSRAEASSVDALRLARIGGDEFVALMPGVTDESQAIALAERVMSILRAPFTLDAHQLVVTPSVGIAVSPQHGRDIETLLMNADTAMYQAKSDGRNRYRIYSSTMNERSLERLQVEADLRRAIAGEKLALHYQPIIEISSGAVVGVEALLRWNHPERGWISPTSFVPVAEESGLIGSLGDWVIKTACRQVRTWSSGPLCGLHVAINVSGQQFVQPGFLSNLMRCVWENSIHADRLELEITESLLLRDAEENISLLQAIKDAGLRVAVDDFGTGYSSLSYLKRLPIDAIKIDRSFVSGLHERRDDAAICAAILAMAHELGLKVVAEGVELEEQYEFLKRHGCDFAQGFLLGRPMPAAEVEKLCISGQPVLPLERTT